MSGGQSYMQQNTRLVVLTLEVRLLLLRPLLMLQPPPNAWFWLQSLSLTVKVHMGLALPFVRQA